MKQYLSIKGKHPDALLLFRVGDFYETFGEDAIKTAEILGIVLTRRANGAAAFVELAGFPPVNVQSQLVGILADKSVKFILPPSGIVVTLAVKSATGGKGPLTTSM